MDFVNLNCHYQVFLHKFHGGGKVYDGYSIDQAIRAARKHDCTKDGDCLAGPKLYRIWPDGAKERVYGWQTPRSFQPANELEFIES